MMKKLSEQQILSILALAGPQRYDHFIKEVACQERAWGLFHDGWAMAESDDNQPVFPLWPAEEYARLCAVVQWAGYEPEQIPLADLLDELIPQLEKDNVLPGIFFTPTSHGVTPTHGQLLEDLRNESLKYE